MAQRNWPRGSEAMQFDKDISAPEYGMETAGWGGMSRFTQFVTDQPTIKDVILSYHAP